MAVRGARLMLATTIVAAVLLALAPPSAGRTRGRPGTAVGVVLTSRIEVASGTGTPAIPGGAAGQAKHPGTLLVNMPDHRICVGRTFTVGVWFQGAGGSRAYRVAISGPRHVRFFYRHGRAPSAHWRFWRVRAGRRGRYIITYSGHWRYARQWDTYRVITRAHRC